MSAFAWMISAVDIGLGLQYRTRCVTFNFLHGYANCNSPVCALIHPCQSGVRILNESRDNHVKPSVKLKTDNSNLLRLGQV
jgi:hypothetical protein